MFNLPMYILSNVLEMYKFPVHVLLACYRDVAIFDTTNVLVDKVIFFNFDRDVVAFHDMTVVSIT